LSKTSFSTLELHPELLKNLSSLGTVAFGLGLLVNLETKNFSAQSLVLCPTRELADQVAKEIRKLARTTQNVKVLTLCGGAPFRAQAESLEHGAHIVVGTPGRVEDHLRKKTLDLSQLKILVLDEADRMLDMGFQASLDAIVDQTPKTRQTLLFSATYPAEIKSIAKRIMLEPVLAQIASGHDRATIDQHFYQVDDVSERLRALRLLLLQYSPESALVFCNTKQEAQDIAEELRSHGFSVRSHGFSALALHGDLDQRDRDQTLVRFSNKSISVLVATDVAARGLDIDSLDAVINYHIARDPEMHVHRIGRTGRAGNVGAAYSLISEKESYKVALLQDYLGQVISSEPLPARRLLEKPANKPTMATLLIDGGKKQKVRPGDILGALTGAKGIAGTQVGKINIFDNRSYVAVRRDAVKQALRKLTEGKLKGRSFRVRHLKGQPRKTPGK